MGRLSLIHSPQELDTFLSRMLTADYVAVDTETNGQDIRDGRGWVQGISIAYRDTFGVHSAYLPFRHDDCSLEPHTKRLVCDFVSKIRKPVFHNAKFDLVSLKTVGIDLSLSDFQDTMLMAHLINENFPYQKSLDACCRHYLSSGSRKFSSPEFDEYVKKVGWVMPAGFMWQYAIADAEITLELFYKLLGYFRSLQASVWPVKQEVTNLLTRVEGNGVLIDQALCKQMVTIGETELAELTDIIGGNLGSPKFLTQLFIDTLGLPVVKTSKKTGAPSFDKEAMQEYDALLESMDNPLAQQVFAYRGWQKSVSSNYRAYLELLSPDGRLRPNFKMHGTRTGRLSCEKPNLQQIPRVSDKPWNGKMKAAFLPREGYTLLEADYSQLELRLATAYAQIPSLKVAFNEGRDVFTEMAAELGMARQDVKTLVYSIQYGAGIPRISHVFRVSGQKAGEIREDFYRRYPGFRSVSDGAKDMASSKKQVPIWSGRFRHFTREDNPGKAFNAMIQGGSADIMERTMLRVDKQLIDGTNARMVLQVHDSIVAEVKNEHVEDYKAQVKQIMEAVEPDFGVRFAVEVKEWGK